MVFVVSGFCRQRSQRALGWNQHFRTYFTIAARDFGQKLQRFIKKSFRDSSIKLQRFNDIPSLKPFLAPHFLLLPYSCQDFMQTIPRLSSSSGFLFNCQAFVTGVHRIKQPHPQHRSKFVSLDLHIQFSNCQPSRKYARFWWGLIKYQGYVNHKPEWNDHHSIRKVIIVFLWCVIVKVYFLPYINLRAFAMGLVLHCK